MRISDWSSDVCSSDLASKEGEPGRNIAHGQIVQRIGNQVPDDKTYNSDKHRLIGERPHRWVIPRQAAPGRLVHIVFFHCKVSEAWRHAWSRPSMAGASGAHRSEEHTSELQSLMSISYAVFCL